MAFKFIHPGLDDYQRKWRNYSVDKNLKNDWLIRLNNLKLLYVTNVCEGHFTCEDTYPRIALMGKRTSAEKLGSLLDNREALISIFDCHIGVDTHFDFSYTIGISNDPHSRSNSSAFTPIKLSLTRTFPRGSLFFDQTTSDWFDRSVSSLEAIDHTMSSMLLLNV